LNSNRFNQGISFSTLNHSVSLSEDEGNQKSCFFPSWTERIQSVLGEREERMITRCSRFSKFQPKNVKFSKFLEEKLFKYEEGMFQIINPLVFSLDCCGLRGLWVIHLFSSSLANNQEFLNKKTSFELYEEFHSYYEKLWINDIKRKVLIEKENEWRRVVYWQRS